MTPTFSPLARSLLSGFRAQGLSLFARVVNDICIVPLFIVLWGTHHYQDWLLLFAAASFVALADLGMQTYFGNLALIAWMRAETRRFQHVIDIAFGIYAAVCGVVLAFLVLAFLVVDLPTWLGVTSLSSHEANVTGALLALSFLVLVPRGIITGIYRARGEFGRAIDFETILALATAAAMMLAMALGAGAPLVAMAHVTVALTVGWGLVIVDQRRRYPNLHYGVARPTLVEIQDTIDKSRWYFLLHAAVILLLNAPVVLLGMLARAPEVVVMFTVSRTLTGLIRQVPQRLADVAGVEMSRHFARHDLAELRALYYKTGQMVGGFSGLMAGLLLAIAEPVITIWTLDKVPYDPWLMLVLMLPMLLTAPAYIGGAVLQFTNQPAPLAVARGAHAVAALILCVALVPSFGAVGAAAGLAIGDILALGMFLTIFAGRRFSIPLGPFLRITLGAAGLALALSYGLAFTLVTLLEPRTLLGLAVFLVAWGATAAPVCFQILVPAPQRTAVLAWLRGCLPSRPRPR